jgi:hypothetical protein
MKKYILQLFDKLWPSYKKSKLIMPNKVDDQQFLHNHSSLSFILDDQDNVDIYCMLPDLNDVTDDTILIIAEKYAKLLLSVNKGLFKSDINKILKKRRTKSPNMVEQLLIDNITIFYRLLEDELNTLKANHEPVIRPSQVFKIK